MPCSGHEHRTAREGTAPARRTKVYRRVYPLQSEQPVLEVPRKRIDGAGLAQGVANCGSQAKEALLRLSFRPPFVPQLRKIGGVGQDVGRIIALAPPDRVQWSLTGLDAIDSDQGPLLPLGISAPAA